MSETLYTSRREFLTGGLTFLSAAATLPLFLGRTARVLAQTASGPARRSDDHRILVVVQLAGGNDGLNTVVPYAMDAYYRYRRQLGIPAREVLRLDDVVGLHPAATGLKELFDDGKLAIIQGVGYPNPNRSHFTSMDIWHTADPQLRHREGWIGRYFDACCRGEDPPDPVQGVALMKEAPLAMQGQRFLPLAFENAEALTWRGPRRDPLAEETFRRLNNIDGDFPPAQNPLADYLQRAALQAQVGAEQIRSAAGAAIRGRRAGARGARGGELARSLELVVRMIAAGLPTRVYYVSMGGFDTHTGQIGRHQQLMRSLGEALQDFINDLRESRLLDRVLVMTFSEFGRRVQENASGGTDHGEAAPMFLVGSCVRPGLHLSHPSLDNLHRGDLAFGCDFRRVYATVLRQWLETPPEKVLGGSFQPLPLLRA